MAKKASVKTLKTKSVTAAAVSPAEEQAQPKRIASAFRLLKSSFEILGKNWKLFAGIALLYGALNMLLVQGFGTSANLGQVKESFDGTFGGGRLATGTGLFAYMLGTSGGGSAGASAYQLVLLVIFSLAVIWTLRQVYANHDVRVRDGLYKGMGALVPFVLVLLVIGAELLPLAIGGAVWEALMSSGVAIAAGEQLLWAGLFFVLTVVSLYLVTSSIFALYIVTLPDMTPMQALRSARQLVKGRRWGVMRKLLFLPIALLLLAAVITIPFILYLTPLAPWVFLILTVLLLPLVHSYFYGLYRELI